jgi:putative endonuclease
MGKCYTYILTNSRNTVFYIGVTTNLKKRIWEHKNKLVDGFTKRYNINKLVKYNTHLTITDAIEYEKSMKKWSRKKKISMIEDSNKFYQDLYNTIL